MQEKQVTIGDTTWTLPEPFLVMATQNPVEQEGTYNLPEAQVDRFMLKIKISYPKKDEEKIILDRMINQTKIDVSRILDKQQIVDLIKLTDEIYISDRVKAYIVDIVHSTREPEEYNLKIKNFIDFGASPRASIFLARAAKGHALLSGRGFVTADDIKSVSFDVLRHRIMLSYEAEAEGVTSEDIITQIFNTILVP